MAYRYLFRPERVSEVDPGPNGGRNAYVYDDDGQFAAKCNTEMVELEKPDKPDDVATIQRMLNGLAEKVDRVGAAAGTSGLDAIEKQVVVSDRNESFDAVVCNPPYRQARSGRLSLSSEKQIARHEIKASLDDFVRAAAFLAKNKGCFACIHLGDRTVDLVSTMRSAGLEPKRLRSVHAFSDAKASMVLVEAVKGGRKGVDILPPLIIYDSAKKYSAELNAIAAGRKSSF